MSEGKEWESGGKLQGGDLGGEGRGVDRRSLGVEGDSGEVEDSQAWKPAGQCLAGDGGLNPSPTPP